MYHNTPDARASQRGELTESSTQFKIAVVRKKLLRERELEYCDLLDISLVGLGMASQWLNAKLGQKLVLELHHRYRKYAVRGIVTRVNVQGAFDHYGIAFIYAPPELDYLIRQFVQENPGRVVAQHAGDENSNNRQWSRLGGLHDTQVLARKADSSAPYVLCEVDNISKGGMGFYCESKISQTVPFTISMQIAQPPDSTQIAGTVHYVSKREGRYYYGMEYDQVSKEFFQLLNHLEEVNH